MDHFIVRMIQEWDTMNNDGHCFIQWRGQCTSLCFPILFSQSVVVADTFSRLKSPGTTQDWLIIRHPLSHHTTRFFVTAAFNIHVMLAPGSQSSPFPTLITVHDAITDSPIYRTNVVHWDEQLDLFEKWLSALSTHMKHYIEKLNSMLQIELLFNRVLNGNLYRVQRGHFGHLWQGSTSS